MKKRLTALLLALSMVLTCIGFSPTAAFAAEENIALNKPATTSRADYNNPEITPSMAVDGTTSTRWASGPYYPQQHGPTDENWICIDLGAVYDISRVVLNWEAAYSPDYDIQVSNDYTTFTTIYNGSASGASVQNLELSGTGRYIRMYANSVYRQDYGTSLYEFEVYGTLSEEQPVTTDTVNVAIESSSNGWTICSTGTWAPKGGETLIRFLPSDNCELESVLVNGEEMIGQVQEDGTLICQADTDLSIVPTYRRVPSSRFEAESTTVVNADGEVINGNIVQDELASGGAYMGSTGGKGFILESTTQANRISVAYASPNTATILVYLLQSDGSYEEIGAINFSTTQGWYMDSLKIAQSDALYIPEGSTIKLVPQVDVNLDYFTLSYGPLNTEENIAASTVLAKNATLNGATVTEDIMSTIGTVAKLDQAGQSVSFTIPEDIGEINVYNLKYRTELDTPVSLTIDGSSKEMTLAATRPHYYASAGEKEIPLQSGDTVSITLLDDGELYLDSISFSYAKPIDRFTVERLPEGSERLELNMNGIWECTSTSFAAGDAVPQAIPQTFDNSIPVPGFWDQASIEMPNYVTSALWYRTTVTLPDAPTGNATLRIGKAYYGRYIYVNGQYVGDYQYNYTSSNTDITPYLHAGENEIVIMLGNYIQQRDDPNCPAHVGTDGERNSFYSGIIDSVTLVLNDDPTVTALQTAPDLGNGSIQARTTLENTSDTDVTTDVTFHIYELGVYENGEPTQEKKLVGTYTEPGVTVPANSSMKFDVDAITIEDCTEDKFWTPSNPFLYEIEVITNGDTYSDRFGMRTFYFDPETKLPMLNGKVHYLNGTNIAMNRFYEDPLRADHPFDPDWARALYQEFKDMHWDSFRFHVGFAPDIWYDIADEEGMLIMDEYAVFGGCSDGCTQETLTPEILTWMDERCNNPSLIIWDIQNEATNLPEYSATIRAVRDYDIQNRPWDNGWTEPQSDTDSCECHPYLFLNNSFTLSDLNSFPNTEMKSSNRDSWGNDNPKILNEYGWLWLDRYGDPTSLTGGYYNTWMPDATREERLEFYAKAIAQTTEFWREGRHYVGIMHFAGLTYSKPNAGGATSDILMPDITDPTVRPCIKEAFRNAFAPVGIIIKDWSETVRPGTVKELPVTIINELNEDLNGLEVTLTVEKDGQQISSETIAYDVKAAGDPDGGDRQVQNFTVRIPRITTGEYTIVASYVRDGETVSSTRTWTIDTSPVSIAEGKKAFASLEEEDYPANNVTDGSDSTRWSSYIEGSPAEDLDNAWITIDLGDTYNINKVRLVWEAAYATEYLIQTSDDNQTYTTIYSGTASEDGEQILEVQGTGRYLRMQGVSRSTSFGYSLYTFDAWGDLVNPPTYDVSVADVTGGTATVTVDQAEALENDLVTVTVADVESGKYVESVTVIDEDGFTVDVTPQEDGTYTFVMPPCAVTIQVVLAGSSIEEPQLLTVQWSGNTSMSVEGNAEEIISSDAIYGAKVMPGEELTFTFTPTKDGFSGAQLNGEDIEFAADGCTYTFTMPGEGTTLRFTFTSVDKSILGIVLEEANAVPQDVIDSLVPSAKEFFENALAKAQEVYDDAAATEAEVKEAWSDLLDAMHLLEFEAGDKETLLPLINIAEQLKDMLDQFKPGTTEGFEEALDAAKDVYAEENPLKADVDEAYDNLQAAIEKLEFRADMSELQSLVDEANTLDPDDYIQDEAFDTFKSVLAEAEELLENANADQADVDAKAEALTRAMAALRKIPNKDELNKLIAEMEQKDLDGYTDRSVAAFKAALSVAKTVAAGETADGQAIAKAYTNLEAAANNLVKAEKPSTGNSGKGSTSANVGNAYGAAGVVSAAQGVASQKAYVVSDTTVNFTLKHGQAYCFKMTVVNGNNMVPSFTVGNGDVLKTQFVAKIGNDYYYRVYAIGTPGQSTGVYTTLPGNAPVKHCAVTIG